MPGSASQRRSPEGFKDLHPAGCDVSARAASLWPLGLRDQLELVADPDWDGEVQALEGGPPAGSGGRRHRFDDDFLILLADPQHSSAIQPDLKGCVESGTAGLHGVRLGGPDFAAPRSAGPTGGQGC